MKVSNYTFLFMHNNEHYAYNSLSNSLIELDTESYLFLHNARNAKNVNLGSLNEDAQKTLIDNRFVTENDEDDYLMYKSAIHNLRRQYNSMHLTIAPTMECCFNCPYCFEKTKGGEAMSETVMDSIINFVLAQSKPLEALNLTWFGGEPLMAIDRMEVFYVKLKQRLSEKIQYSSNIITSGYHLDKYALAILKNLHVSSIQVTIDGLKETHNKIKYLSSCEDVFSKVINNIDYATRHEKDIHVTIRVNLTLANAEEYPILYKWLVDRFGQRSNISIAPAFVLDRSAMTTGSVKSSTLFTHKERSKYILELANKNLDSPFLHFPKPFFSECAIRNANAISFDPEGYAYKCWEKIGDKDYAVWKLSPEGHLENINTKLLNRLMYGADPIDDHICSKCRYLPICGGGCPLQRMENNFEGKNNTLCTFYKGFLPEFLGIHIERKKLNIFNY